MRLLLGTLVNAIPQHEGSEDPLTARLPPLTITPSGPEIDYSLLLVAEELVVDETSLDYLEGHGDVRVRNVGASIRTLSSEGFVDVQNFCALLEGEAGVERAAQLAARDPAYWVQGLREHIRKYEQLRPSFIEFFGEHMSPWDRQIFPIANYYANRDDGAVNGVAARRLANMILRKNPADMTAGEVEATRAVIVESIRGISGQTVVAHKTNSFSYAWHTFDHMFEMLASYSPVSAPTIERNVRACRDFFEFAYPESAPKTQSEWLRLLRHKNVSSLRERIAAAVKAGDTLDAEFARREYVKLLQALDEKARKKTMIGRGIDGAGIVAGAAVDWATSGLPILSSILAGTTVGGAGSLGRQTIDGLVDADDRFRWMYFRSTS